MRQLKIAAGSGDNIELSLRCEPVAELYSRVSIYMMLSASLMLSHKSLCGVNYMATQ